MVKPVLYKPVRDVQINMGQQQGAPRQRYYLGRQESYTVEYHRLGSPELVDEDKLIEAVRSNNVDSVRSILQAGQQDPNEIKSGDFLSPLEIAVQKGFVVIVDLLLNHGADVAAANDQWQSTPLHIAVKRNRLECLHLLLEADAQCFALDRKQRTPFHLAVALGRMQMCEKMYECVKVRSDERRRTNAAAEKLDMKLLRATSEDNFPVHIAAKEGQVDILKFLLSLDPKYGLKNDKGVTALQFAAENGHTECCRVLLEAAGEDRVQFVRYFDAKSRTTALIAAATNGHATTCELLSDSDVNFQDKIGNTALHYACHNKYRVTIATLLDMDADPYVRNDEQDSCIHKAARKNDEMCLNVLIGRLTRRPAPNKDGHTVLHGAAELMCTDNVKLLMDHASFREDVNVLDKYQRSPFHVCTRNGDEIAFAAMLSHGADARLIDGPIRRNLPLHLAARHGSKHMCSLLLRGRLRDTLNAKNGNGATPLHAAIFCRDEHKAVEVCSYLLSKKPTLDIEDKFGNAPLFVAVKHKKTHLTELLVRAGALRGVVPDQMGNNPLHLAAKCGDLESCRILMAAKMKFLTGRNRHHKQPITLAFDENQVAIFKLFLDCTVLKAQDKNRGIFEQNVHEFMHEALKDNRRGMVEAIVNSGWWWCGFCPKLCRDKVCRNFRDLIRAQCDLACVVMDKCISCDTDETTFDFRLLEDTYYVDRGTKGVAIDWQKVDKLPFDTKTGQLDKMAVQFPGRNWTRGHPLRVAIEGDQLDILTHRLTNAYLRHKWNSLTFVVYFALLFLEFFSVILQGLNLGYSVDLAKLNISGNCTEEWPAEEHDANWGIRNWLGSFTLLILMAHFGLEINFICKLGWSYVKSSCCIVRIFRIIGLAVFCVPLYTCALDLGVKVNHQWPVGIFTFLISGLLLMMFINELPIISLSMPVTGKFMASFVRVLGHVFLILLIFAVLFHFLLGELDAFVSVPDSLIKSLVWLLGDLAYDDAFVSNPTKIFYPNISKWIFVIFVTSVSTAALNAVISVPSEHWTRFKERAVVVRAANRVTLALDIDVAFGPKCVGYVTRNKQSRDKSPVLLAYGDIVNETQADDTQLLAALSHQSQIMIANLEAQQKMLQGLTAEIAQLKTQFSTNHQS